MKQNEMAQIAQFWNDTAHDFDRIYTGQKSGFARALDQWFRKDMYQRLAWVLDRSGDVRNAAICDVGCGSGRFVKELAQRGASRVVGVDVAPEMLRIARTVADEAGVAARCEFAESDILEWKTSDTFDLTIAIGFWDYIRDPRARLDVIRQITRGRFLSAWPRLWSWRVPIRKVRLAARGCPVYFYRMPQVHALLAQSGFAVERTDVVGKLFCVEARAV
jgi:SAM-dependent methyltransferase